jgi:hypothetical protein
MAKTWTKNLDKKDFEKKEINSQGFESLPDLERVHWSFESLLVDLLGQPCLSSSEAKIEEQQGHLG